MYKHQKARFFLSMAVSAHIYACNSRPNYDIAVLEFHSDCAEAQALVVRIEHDPDPEEKKVTLEPGYEQVAAQANMKFSDDGMHLRVEFGDDTVCQHRLAGTFTGCFSRGTGESLSCSSCLKPISYRWPSKGPGFGGALGREGEDTPVPNAEDCPN